MLINELCLVYIRKIKIHENFQWDSPNNASKYLKTFNELRFIIVKTKFIKNKPFNFGNKTFVSNPSILMILSSVYYLTVHTIREILNLSITFSSEISSFFSFIFNKTKKKKTCNTFFKEFLKLLTKYFLILSCWRPGQMFTS